MRASGKIAAIFTAAIIVTHYASASIEITASTNKHYYQIGEYVTVSITAYNPGSETVKLGFPDWYQADYTIDGVYRWSYHLGFPTEPINRIIEPHSSFTWNLVHRSYQMQNYPLLAGTHTVIGEIYRYGFADPIHFHVIAEPTTLLLLGLGGVMLKRRLS